LHWWEFHKQVFYMNKETIKNAPWLQDASVQKIFNLLDGENYRTRAVGGIVRDSVMGRLGETNDVDFATELLPDEVVERAKKAGYKSYPTGIEHGTVTIAIDKKMFEITSLRQDIKTDGRHAIVQFGTDWLIDAKRRDFTINALYVGFDGRLFDPLERGIDDCQKAHVRFIGKADKRIEEDKLRVYRFFRFSASHGKQIFDENGLEACKNAANDLGNISAERIGVEMMKMLALPKISKTIAALMTAKIISQNSKILEHFNTYENIVKNPNRSERLAILFEQIKPKELQETWRLSNAQIKISQKILNFAKMLANSEIREVAYQLSLEKPSLKNSSINVASALFNYDKDKTKQLQKLLGAIKVPSFPISGKDLLNIGIISGEGMGKTLVELKTQWIKSDFKLSRKQLLKKVKVK